MIAIYVSIVIILFAYFISLNMNKKKQQVSNLGICSICHNTFQDNLIKEQDSLSFCFDHFQSYRDNTWVLVESVECSVGNEKESVDLFEKQRTLYHQGVMGYLKPSYMQSGDIIITVLDYYQIKKP
jgi:hypothetical protein